MSGRNFEKDIGTSWRVAGEIPVGIDVVNSDHVSVFFFFIFILISSCKQLTIEHRATKQPMKDHYGIVIDSGSSGSRIQIYRWQDPNELVKNPDTDPKLLRSVPQIYQEESWTLKTSPGVSSFADKPKKVWDKHYEDLIEYAEKIIPKSNWSETPIFIQATAGMRLLPKEKRDKLLSTICKNLKKHSKFLVESCEKQIEIIDGETEGIYGWIGLNYLMGQLDDYDSNASKHPTYGFMDMGGASTQISFVPSKEDEITKHQDDISRVYLRNVNGELQQWDVFVSTWLGFGANEARKRYLNQLINLLPSPESREVSDPCLPKNLRINYKYKKQEYKISGTGNSEQCLKTTYPLLLKNLPCKDDPCLFNGVHAPEIDFLEDKFVGISEYWYTANDVFHMGGEYNFLKFNEKVKLFCETDWAEIQKNNQNGEYNNVPEKILQDACFKANWVLNVLHEGFNLPRIDIETPMPDDINEDELKNHIPFQSAGSIKGAELSWTLGKILLYASSQVASRDGINVGVQPSDNQIKFESKKFIFGGIDKFNSINSYKDSSYFSYLLFFLLVGGLVYAILFKRSSFKTVQTMGTQLIKKYVKKFNNYKYMKVSTQQASDLEEGIASNTLKSNSNTVEDDDNGNSFNLRTRSLANLSKFTSNAANSSTSSSNNKRPLQTAHSLLDFSQFRRADFFNNSTNSNSKRNDNINNASLNLDTTE